MPLLHRWRRPERPLENCSASSMIPLFRTNHPLQFLYPPIWRARTFLQTQAKPQLSRLVTIARTSFFFFNRTPKQRIRSCIAFSHHQHRDWKKIIRMPEKNPKQQSLYLRRNIRQRDGIKSAISNLQTKA